MGGGQFGLHNYCKNHTLKTVLLSVLQATKKHSFSTREICTTGRCNIRIFRLSGSGIIRSEMGPSKQPLTGGQKPSQKSTFLHSHQLFWLLLLLCKTLLFILFLFHTSLPAVSACVCIAAVHRRGKSAVHKASPKVWLFLWHTWKKTFQEVFLVLHPFQRKKCRFVFGHEIQTRTQ